MTEQQAMRMALKFIVDIHPAFICEAMHHTKAQRHTSLEPCPHVEAQQQVAEALRQALMQQPADEPMKKLKVTLEDRPIDIELAQYKRMFEDACSALGEVGDALGIDPNEGGAESILFAIEELRGRSQEPMAWMVYTLDGTSVCVTDNPKSFTPEHRALPLYTIPPQRKPLTETEIRTIRCDIAGTLDVQYVVFARAIEAAHGIKE